MLHTHDIAITPVDFLIKDASYRDNLYICEPASNSELVLFQYAPGKPADLPTCQYELVSTRRAQVGAQQFDARLRTIFSLYTDNPQGRLYLFRQHKVRLYRISKSILSFLTNRGLPRHQYGLVGV